MSDKSDYSDSASLREEIQRNECMLFRKPVVQPCGFCNFCSDPIASGMQFCNGVDCRDGWEIERAARERNGR